jgi:hypothetical protein
MQLPSITPAAKQTASALDSFWAFFQPSAWQGEIFDSIKIFSLVFSIFLFFLVVVLIIKSDRLWKMKLLKESKGVVNLPKDFDKRWLGIQGRMAKGDEANTKLAIIEADKMFDKLLYFMGYHEKDMGEKLKQMTSAQLPNLDDIWLAHKVRNRIVHEPDHHLTRSEAESAILAYEKAFKEFEVL